MIAARNPVNGVGSALANFEARKALVNNVNPALASHDDAVPLPAPGRLQRVSDLHGFSRSTEGADHKRSARTLSTRGAGGWRVLIRLSGVDAEQWINPNFSRGFT
jgi:hypothetical protein